MGRRTRLVVGLLSVAVVALVVVVVVLLVTNNGPAPTPPSSSPATSPTTSPPTSTPSSSSTTAPAAPASTITCTNNTTTDTAALSNAIASAQSTGGTVSIAAGTCALDARLKVTGAVTIQGAGATSTSLVQHARASIFRITADGVTVQDLNLDVATYNTTAPQLKNPDPLALISNANRTTVRNIDVEAGSGFGIRFVGPQPCYTDLRTGDVITGVNATTTGKGGFASVDVDCQNGATLSNITIHGGILSLYQDQNVTLNGETFTPGPGAVTCAVPWFVTGPSQNISIDNVTSAGGAGKITQTAGSKQFRANSVSVSSLLASQHISVTNQNVTNPACSTGLAG